MQLSARLLLCATFFPSFCLTGVMTEIMLTLLWWTEASPVRSHRLCYIKTWWY